MTLVILVPEALIAELANGSLCDKVAGQEPVVPHYNLYNNFIFLVFGGHQ